MVKAILHKIMTTTLTFFAKTAVAEIGRDSKINYPCKFSKKTHIGSDCHFNGMKIYGYGEVRIGDHFHSGKGCIILTSNHNYKSSEVLPYDNTWITENVTIGRNVWLGMNVTILPGVNIGEGAIIQAGSVVVKDIPKCAIAGGHPALVFSQRDPVEYESALRSQSDAS